MQARASRIRRSFHGSARSFRVSHPLIAARAFSRHHHPCPPSSPSPLALVHVHVHVHRSPLYTCIYIYTYARAFPCERSLPSATNAPRGSSIAYAEGDSLTRDLFLNRPRLGGASGTGGREGEGGNFDFSSPPSEREGRRAIIAREARGARPRRCRGTRIGTLARGGPRGHRDTGVRVVVSGEL